MATRDPPTVRSRVFHCRPPVRPAARRPPCVRHQRHGGDPGIERISCAPREGRAAQPAVSFGADGQGADLWRCHWCVHLAQDRPETARRRDLQPAECGTFPSIARSAIFAPILCRNSRRCSRDRTARGSAGGDPSRASDWKRASGKRLRLVVAIRATSGFCRTGRQSQANHRGGRVEPQRSRQRPATGATLGGRDQSGCLAATGVGRCRIRLGGGVRAACPMADSPGGGLGTQGRKPTEDRRAEVSAHGRNAQEAANRFWQVCLAVAQGQRESAG